MATSLGNLWLYCVLLLSKATVPALRLWVGWCATGREELDRTAVLVPCPCVTVGFVVTEILWPGILNSRDWVLCLAVGGAMSSFPALTGQQEWDPRLAQLSVLHPESGESVY